MIPEFLLLEKIRAQVPLRLREQGRLRDDTAILTEKAGTFLLTTDALIEGVDFLRTTPPELVGRKALAVNLSDIAAMGGLARSFTVALGLPARLNARWVARFYNGLLKWARHFNVTCAGGDISSAKEIMVSVTVLGRAAGAAVVRRSGARPGDWIGVSGRLGGSILGHHLRFKPRVQEGRCLARAGARAMIDVSDGFLQDLGHILKESKAGARLELSAIPVSPDALKKARGDARQALDYALSDGEDFELIFTLPPQKAVALARAWPKKFPRVKLSWVGKVTVETGQIRWQQHGRACAAPRLKKKGYQHFA